jgi:hypothetical protein
MKTIKKRKYAWEFPNLPAPFGMKVVVWMDTKPTKAERKKYHVRSAWV